VADAPESAPEREEAARRAERDRIVEIIARLRANATCRTVKKTCTALIERIQSEWGK
jgi:hypothetical protein